MIPSDEKILDAVQKLVAEVLRISVEDVTIDSLLGDELGGESMDFVDIQFRLETDCGIEFYHGNIVEKLSELLAPKKLDENGLLTPWGAAVLQRRMPEISPARLGEGMPAVGIEAFFTPRTFIRLVKEIISARPEVCPQCQSDQFKVVRPSVLACEACHTEVQCPTGEECLEAWARKVAPSLREIQPSTSG